MFKAQGKASTPEILAIVAGALKYYLNVKHLSSGIRVAVKFPSTPHPATTVTNDRADRIDGLATIRPGADNRRVCDPRAIRKHYSFSGENRKVEVVGGHSFLEVLP